MTEQEYDESTENLKKFGSWIVKWVTRSVYLAYRLTTKAGQQAWRPLFCWAGGAVILAALYSTYIALPSMNIVLPEYFLASLNTTFITMGGVLGIRGIEKGFNAYFSMEQSRRLEQQ